MEAGDLVKFAARHAPQNQETHADQAQHYHAHVFFENDSPLAPNTATAPRDRFHFDFAYGRFFFVDAYSQYVHLGEENETDVDFASRVFCRGYLPRSLQSPRSHKRHVEKFADWLYRYRIPCVLIPPSEDANRDEAVEAVKREIAAETLNPSNQEFPLQLRINAKKGPGQNHSRISIYANAFRLPKGLEEPSATPAT